MAAGRFHRAMGIQAAQAYLREHEARGAVVLVSTMLQL